MKYESVVFFKILLTAIFDIFYKKQRGVCIYIMICIIICIGNFLLYLRIMMFIYKSCGNNWVYINKITIFIFSWIC